MVLAALDRVAKTQEPESLGVFCTTDSLVAAATACAGSASGCYWPSWVMCSVPLPGLDRYMPTRPPACSEALRSMPDFSPWVNMASNVGRKLIACSSCWSRPGSSSRS